MIAIAVTSRCWRSPRTSPPPRSSADYFQDTDPRQLFGDCSHYIRPVATASHISRAFDTAIRAPIGGVTLVILPGDVALQDVPSQSTAHWIEPAAPLMLPNAAELDTLVTMLNGAERATRLCGGGCAGA